MNRLTAIAALLLALTRLVHAQVPALIGSTNDGAGLFTYTFSDAGIGSVWAFNTNLGTITMQSAAVLSVVNPPGWTSSVDTNDLIIWSVTLGPMYIEGAPLVFSVFSAHPDPVYYDATDTNAPFHAGIILSSVVTASNHLNAGAGFQQFSYVGPSSVPEPSTFVLAVLGLMAFVILRKRSARR